MFRIAPFIYCLFITFYSIGITPIDSLKIELSKTQDDSVKVVIYNKICKNLIETDAQQTIEYGEQAQKLASQIGFTKGEALSIYYLGLANKIEGKFETALDYFLISAKLYQKIKSYTSVGALYGEIALIYQEREDYKNAIDNYLYALKAHESANYTDGQTFCLEQLGILYENINEHKQALNYRIHCLEIDTKSGSKTDISKSMTNLGGSYQKLGRYKESFEMHNNAYLINLELNDSLEIAKSLGNMGNVLLDQKLYNQAIEFFKQGLSIFLSINNLEGITKSYNNLAETYYKMGNYDLALQNAEKSLKIALKLGLKENIKTSYYTLSDIYHKLEDNTRAYEFFKLYSETNNFLISQESSGAIAKMQSLYETDKKQKEITLLNTNKKLQDAEIERQSLYILSGTIGLFFIILFAIFIFRSYKQKQKDNLLLEKQNFEIRIQRDEIVTQKDIIEEKNQEINHILTEVTDSINYAKRIQEAILTTTEYRETLFPKINNVDSHFVFFKPKDIVSGDFYWAYLTKSNKAVWAAADCTGHGVPGAFMSMIGNSLLNEIVVENGYEDSDIILNKLREGVIKSLKQSGEAGRQKDGMDISLCVWNKNTNILQWSGANNPLWIFRNSELHEIKADKQPIGYYSELMKPFSRNEWQLQKKDCLYSFSDGFIDQFGGPKGKKFKSSQLRETLLKIHHLPMNEQKKELKNIFNNWIADLEQLDDVCVIGVEI